MSLRIPGFVWIGSWTSGNSYVNNGQQPKILLHMTVSSGLSMSYAQGHPYPPQSWASCYTGDKWQSIEMDRAGMALYQPSYTNSYLNKNWFCSQTELVGVPVVNQKTYSDQQCKWIGENVIAPIWQAFHSVGVDVNLNNVKYHTDSSGSANEYWAGRMSDEEWWNWNGVCCHIDAVGNDHWDCSVEDIIGMVNYAKAFLGQGGGTTPQPEKKGIMPMRQALNDPNQGGNGTLYIYNEFGDCWALRSDSTRQVLVDLGILENMAPLKVHPNTFNILHMKGIFEDSADAPLA